MTTAKTTQQSKTFKIVGLGILTAIIVVLQVVTTYFPTKPFAITLALIPIVIGAALFGAGDVLAIDIDPDAVRVADENVKHNRVDGTVSVRQGNLLDHVDAVCDICVANIISDVIIAFAAPLRDHIRPGGLFICSGIIAPRADEVAAAVEKACRIWTRLSG